LGSAGNTYLGKLSLKLWKSVTKLFLRINL
jgi:hypothetical protein